MTLFLCCFILLQAQLYTNTFQKIQKSSNGRKPTQGSRWEKRLMCLDLWLERITNPWPRQFLGRNMHNFLPNTSNINTKWINIFIWLSIRHKGPKWETKQKQWMSFLNLILIDEICMCIQWLLLKTTPIFPSNTFNSRTALFSVTTSYTFLKHRLHYVLLVCFKFSDMLWSMNNLQVAKLVTENWIYSLGSL